MSDPLDPRSGRSSPPGSEPPAGTSGTDVGPPGRRGLTTPAPGPARFGGTAPAPRPSVEGTVHDVQHQVEDVTDRDGRSRRRRPIYAGVTAGALLVVAVVVIDRVMLAAETRGWVRWRRSPPSTVAAGTALLEILSLYEPAHQPVVEERRSARTDDAEDGDPLDPTAPFGPSARGRCGREHQDPSVSWRRSR